MSLYAPQIQSKGLFGFLNQCSEILCSCEDLVLLKYFSLFMTNIIAWVCKASLELGMLSWSMKKSCLSVLWAKQNQS